jgi:hypothetical protein
VGEFLVRFLFETIFMGLLKGLGYLGYLIARATVPILSAGQVGVVPPPKNYVLYTKWHGLHRLSDGSIYMGKSLAGVCGLVLAVLALILIGTRETFVDRLMLKKISRLRHCRH